MNVKIVSMMMIERECEVLIYVDSDLQYLGKTKKSKNLERNIIEEKNTNLRERSKTNQIINKS